MRIVLDTNVIISALLTPSGPPAKIINLVLDGTIKLAYNNEILDEYMDVLFRKELKINRELAEYVLTFVKKEGEFIIAKPNVRKFTDEADKKFFEVYKSASAIFLVTGNIKHFPQEPEIVIPRVFLEKFMSINNS